MGVLQKVYHGIFLVPSSMFVCNLFFLFLVVLWCLLIKEKAEICLPRSRHATTLKRRKQLKSAKEEIKGDRRKNKVFIYVTTRPTWDILAVCPFILQSPIFFFLFLSWVTIESYFTYICDQIRSRVITVRLLNKSVQDYLREYRQYIIKNYKHIISCVYDVS